MAARKRRTLPRTIAVSTIRNGRVYFWLAAWRTMSKSRLTSACVSKSCSWGCCLATAACLLRPMLLGGRSPIYVSPKVAGMNLSLRNVANATCMSHDRILQQKTSAEYRDDPPGVKGLDKLFYPAYSAVGPGKPQHLVGQQTGRLDTGQGHAFLALVLAAA